MEQELVSVIVPVYNAEKYIKKCIDSVRNQSYKKIEVLLIDDGSKDESGAICDFYEKEDERIHVFHKKNGGPSAARNFGLQQATGRYIIFIDADDYVEDYYIAELLSARKKISFQDGTLVCSAYIDVSEYGRVICNDFKQDSQNLIQSVITGTGGVVWGKLFDRKTIQEHGICFDEDLYISEDMIFVLQYVKYVREYVTVEKPGYVYNRLNEQSIIRSIELKDVNAYERFFGKLRHSLQEQSISFDVIENDMKNRRKMLLYKLITSSGSVRELKEVINDEVVDSYIGIPSHRGSMIFLARNKRYVCLFVTVKIYLTYSSLRRLVIKILRGVRTC